jgi:5-hydroxyisourate hydrolase
VSLSTHVLDTAAGEPAAGVPVRLEVAHDGAWRRIADALTDVDGRVRDLVSGEDWHVGTYRLTFDTAARSAFFPEVAVVFFVTEPARHHHVPLLLSPYGYSTYRGS